MPVQKLDFDPWVSFCLKEQLIVNYQKAKVLMFDNTKVGYINGKLTGPQ